MGQIGSPQAITRSVHVPRHTMMVRATVYDCGNGIFVGILKARVWATTTICID